MDFLICYEHIAREIENDTLIKHELESRGYSCKIIHFNDIDAYLHMTKEKANVVVTPWLRYDINVCRYLSLAKKPYKLVNLQWEQVYSERSLKAGLTSTSGQALNACHMCWGENSRNRLVGYGVPEENVAIVGAIQMDYGNPLFRDYYLSRHAIAQQFGLDEQKKWNLLISSFAYANYGDDSIRSMEKSFNMSLYETVQLHRQSQGLTLDWVETLLKTTDCEFIYRPHPSEKVDARLNVMKKTYPNFHVISQSSVKQWAQVCDKVNLWISTSNAELLSLGVDFAIVRPVEIEWDREVESMHNETFITDCDTFINYNTTYDESSAAAIEKKLQNISYFYSHDPNYPAYKRTADYLEQVYKRTEGQTYHFTFKQHLQKNIDAVKRYIISRLTHKCWVSGSLKPVQYLPLKPIIKRNMGLAIQKRQNKEAVENAMLTYLETHSGNE